MKKIFNVGIDVGSTTVKIVVLDKDKVIFKKYTRHFSDVKKAVKEVLTEVYEKLGDIRISTVVTGSGGIDISKYLGLKFVQEVISSTKAIETFNPETDVVIELGGEDAKITLFKWWYRPKNERYMCWGYWRVYRSNGQFIKNRCRWT